MERLRRRRRLPPPRLRTGLQGSVPEEAVHREGRCAASGEAPDRSVPMRYGEEGERCRGGCSGPRMPGSEGMELWRPAGIGFATMGISSGHLRDRWGGVE